MSYNIKKDSMECILDIGLIKCQIILPNGRKDSFDYDDIEIAEPYNGGIRLRGERGKRDVSFKPFKDAERNRIIDEINEKTGCECELRDGILYIYKRTRGIYRPKYKLDPANIARVNTSGAEIVISQKKGGSVSFVPYRTNVRDIECLIEKWKKDNTYRFSFNSFNKGVLCLTCGHEKQEYKLADIEHITRTQEGAILKLKNSIREIPLRLDSSDAFSLKSAFDQYKRAVENKERQEKRDKEIQDRERRAQEAELRYMERRKKEEKARFEDMTSASYNDTQRADYQTYTSEEDEYRKPTPLLIIGLFLIVVLLLMMAWGILGKGAAKDKKEHEPAASSIEYIYPLVWDLNIRKSASLKAESVGHAEQMKAYAVLDVKEADGYVWYKIGSDKWIASNEGSWTRLVENNKADPLGFVLDNITGYDDWLKHNVPNGSSDYNWYRWIYEKNQDGSYSVVLMYGDKKNRYEEYSCTLIEENGVFKIKQ